MEVVVGLFMFTTGLFMTGRLYHLNCHRPAEKHVFLATDATTNHINNL
jgi:hypothetical protein